MHSFAPAAIPAALLLAAPQAWAQSPFATSVVQFQQGTGGGIFVPANALGGPQGAGLGAGSLHVLTLGEGGSVTLGFDVTLVDGPGADLTVFENGFVIAGTSQVFAEILHVEVSSDGVQFARFPAHYQGPGTPMGALRGLAGGLPVLANVLAGGVNPLDPVVSGGEAFDLADLAQDPGVRAGAVDLQAIHFVRLVDVLPGEVDGAGTPLPALGGSDVDAVAVLNSATSSSASQPVCDLWIDDQDRLHWLLGDPDGLLTLDFSSVRASLDLAAFPASALLPVFQVQALTPEEVHFVSQPLTGSGIVAALGLGVQDVDGHASADQAMVQG
jgi:hypothetical protein